MMKNDERRVRDKNTNRSKKKIAHVDKRNRERKRQRNRKKNIKKLDYRSKGELG